MNDTLKNCTLISVKPLYPCEDCLKYGCLCKKCLGDISRWDVFDEAVRRLEPLFMIEYNFLFIDEKNESPYNLCVPLEKINHFVYSYPTISVNYGQTYNCVYKILVPDPWFKDLDGQLVLKAVAKIISNKNNIR